MNRHMITLSCDNVQFGLRVAVIAIHDGYMLLHRAEHDDFWALPVGRAELLEPAAESLKREMVEEMNAQVCVTRLLWVLESFCEYQQPYHELGLYSLVQLEPDFPHYDKTQPFFGREDGPDGDADLVLIFRWFPISELEDIDLYPTFLRTALKELPAHTQHIVHYDPDGERRQ